MIYRIQLYTDQLSGSWTWEDVWCYKDGHFDVGETSWVRSANAISSLTFDCYPTNQCHDLLGGNSRVRILNAEGWADTGDYYGFKTEFCGRVIEVTPQMDEDGTVYKNVVCEDALGFLQDSVLYFDSNKGWFDGKSDAYPVEIDGDGVRSIGAEDLVRLIVWQHNSTVTANDKMGDKSWKKVYVGYLDLTHDDGSQLEVDLDPQYEKTGYELLADVCDELGAQFSVTYDEGGNKPMLNVALELGDDNVGDFEVGDNLAQSALETSIAATATRLFPWGDEYSKLKETKPKGTDVKGRLKGTDWETGGSYYMARFKVEGGLKAHITVGRRNKDYGMVVFTSKALTKANADKKDVVVRKYTTKAKSTGDNIDKWYPVPEDAVYCYVYGPTSSGSKVVLYSEYTATDGTDTWVTKDKYRVDLAFWLKYLSDKDKKAALKKWKLTLGSVTDKSDDKLYYLAANEDKYGVIEGAFEVDRCHLKTDKITQASTKITSVTDLVTVGKSKTAKWRRRRARIFFRAACKQAAKLCNESVSVSAKVVDMRAGSYESYPELHLFDKWHLRNDKCGIDVKAQLTRISCDLREPWDAEVEFGDKVTRASGVGGGYGGALSKGNMGDFPSETDGDDASDEYTSLANQYAEAASSAAKEAIEKAAELDNISYRMEVDSIAAGQLASESYDLAHPIVDGMRSALEQTAQQAHEATATKEALSKTVEVTTGLARAVATYGYETEKSAVRWKQTYYATQDAWASQDPEVQAQIKAAYAKLYGEGGTAESPTEDSAQGRLNAAKAGNVEAAATEAEMRTELASAQAYLSSCNAQLAKDEASYKAAKAAYDKARKKTTATRKEVDAQQSALNAAKAKRDKSEADVAEAEQRCSEAEASYARAKTALADAEGKVEKAQAEVDTAMNGIHELYSTCIEQNAKYVDVMAKELVGEDEKTGQLRVTPERILANVTVNGKGTHYNQESGKFEWSVDTANSISSMTVEFMCSDSGSTRPTGSWYGTAEEAYEAYGSAKSVWLWSRTTVKYTGELGDSVTYGVSYSGEDGESGKGVSSISSVTSYARSTSSTTTPSSWSSSVSGASMAKGYYLWTRTATAYEYTDGTSQTKYSYSVSYWGRDGSNGKDGDPSKYMSFSEWLGLVVGCKDSSGNWNSSYGRTVNDGESFRTQKYIGYGWQDTSVVENGSVTFNNWSYGQLLGRLVIGVNSSSYGNPGMTFYGLDGATEEFELRKNSSGVQLSTGGNFFVGLKDKSGGSNSGATAEITAGRETDETWLQAAHDGKAIFMYTKGGGNSGLSVSGYAALGTNNWLTRFNSSTGMIQHNTASSRLLKENIEPVQDSDGLALLDVSVVRFDYKCGTDPVARKGHVGVIAEDLFTVIPRLVTSKDETKTAELYAEGDTSSFGVDYAGFSPYLIKLCQMQQKQIDDLQARVRALEESR